MGLFLCLTLIEYFFRFDSNTRLLLLLLFILLTGWTMTGWVFLPYLKKLRWIKALGHREAAHQLSQYFEGISDKIISTLELRQGANSGESKALVIAAVEQKAAELKMFSIEDVLPLQGSFKYIKYALFPAIALIVAYLIYPDMIRSGSERILNYNEAFIPPAPFEFITKAERIEIVKGRNAEIEVMLKGNTLPNVVYLIVDGQSYRMSEWGKNRFRYILHNVQKEGYIWFSAGGYFSNKVELRLLPNPRIKSVVAHLEYPRYTNKGPEKLKNSMLLILPEGTRYTMHIETEGTDALTIFADTGVSRAESNGTGRWVFSRKAGNTERVELVPLFKKARTDTLTLSVEVIRDAFPEIKAGMFADSSTGTLFYFSGMARDDYGVSKIEFVVSDNQLGNEKTYIVSSGQPQPSVSFNHLWQIEANMLHPGSTLKAWFRVWDNDGVNGSKYSQTQLFVVEIPSTEAIQTERKQKTDDLEKELKNQLETAENIQKQMEAFKKKLIEQKQITIEERREFSNLIKQHKQIRQQALKAQQEYKRSNEKKRNFEKSNEDLFEKQLKLQELMEKVLDKELLKELEDLQKKIEEMNKDQIKDALDAMELNQEELKKEIDRSLELMKQLEFEQQLHNQIDKMKRLEENQRELLNRKSGESENLLRQVELEQKLDELKKEMEALKDKNNDLQEPNKLPDIQQELNRASEQMKKASDEMRKGGNKKRSESQEQAADELEKAGEKLSQFQEQMEHEQSGEDLQMLRRLRQNLMTLSFDQEEQMSDLKISEGDDPKLVQITRNQQRLSDNAKVVEDSLMALAKRNVEISEMVNKELTQINTNMKRAISAMAERNRSEGLNRQQLVMTSLNNLAVMIDESIQKSQNDQAKKKGSKNCKKPGSGKPIPGSMKQEQRGMLKQMQELKKRLDALDKKQGKDGKKPTLGRGTGLTQDLAKAAARQAAIREELRRLMEEMGGNQEVMQQLKQIDQLLEQNEKDLLNYEITKETLQRQEDILTRMLESEKAEREQQEDKQRESRQAKDFPSGDSLLLKYLRERDYQNDLLESKPMNMNGFYRERVDGYFKQISFDEK